MITPLEIRQQAFKKGLRGYDADEVRAFLTALSNEWEATLEQHNRLRTELETARIRLGSFEQVENVLHKTLYQAEQSSKSTIETAQREADVVLQEARQKARELTAEAQQARQQALSEVNVLLLRRDELLSQLRGLLNGQLERLASYERIQLALQPSSVGPKPSTDTRFDLPTPDES
jgi:cell division initiation protein